MAKKKNEQNLIEQAMKSFTPEQLDVLKALLNAVGASGTPQVEQEKPTVTKRGRPRKTAPETIEVLATPMKGKRPVIVFEDAAANANPTYAKEDKKKSKGWKVDRRPPQQEYFVFKCSGPGCGKQIKVHRLDLKDPVMGERPSYFCSGCESVE